MLYALCALRYAIGSGIRSNRMGSCIYIPHSEIRNLQFIGWGDLNFEKNFRIEPVPILQKYGFLYSLGLIILVLH